MSTIPSTASDLPGSQRFRYCVDTRALPPSATTAWTVTRHPPNRPSQYPTLSRAIGVTMPTTPLPSTRAFIVRVPLSAIYIVSNVPRPAEHLANRAGRPAFPCIAQGVADAGRRSTDRFSPGPLFPVWYTVAESASQTDCGPSPLGQRPSSTRSPRITVPHGRLSPEPSTMHVAYKPVRASRNDVADRHPGLARCADLRAPCRRLPPPLCMARREASRARYCSEGS